MSFLLFLISGGGDTFGSGCLAASGRQAGSDRQLLAHPPVSAEPRWRGFGLPLQSDV